MTLQANLDEEERSSIIQREEYQSADANKNGKMTEEDIFHPTFHSLSNQSNK